MNKVRPVVLRGYSFSVYNWVAAMVLCEKGVTYEREEINPFSAALPGSYRVRHSFGRVPVLSHGDFDVYETVAIAHYVNAAFVGPTLVPPNPRAVARMAQVISIIDAYGYGAMVRKVFANRVFLPSEGEPADEDMIATGLEASCTVLGALDRIATEGLVLDGSEVTLADCHLAPMLAYFIQAPEGAAALHNYTALSDWWTAIGDRQSIRMTDPGLPGCGN